MDDASALVETSPDARHPEALSLQTSAQAVALAVARQVEALNGAEHNDDEHTP